MIAIANEIACKRPGCTHPVIQPSGGHRRREYCSDACKMKDQRRKLAEQQQAHEVELAYELNQLRGERDILQVQVRSLSGQVKRLQSALSQLEQEAVRSRDSVHRIEQYAMACSLGEQQAKEELTKAQSALSQLEQEAACRPQVSRTDALARLMILGERLDYCRLLLLDIKPGAAAWWEAINEASDTRLQEILSTAQAFYDNLQASVQQNLEAYQQKLTQAGERINKLEQQVSIQRERLGQYYQQVHNDKPTEATDEKHSDQAQPSSPTKAKKMTRQRGDSLPDGFVSLNTFAQQHAVSVNEVRRLACMGLIHLAKGRWQGPGGKVAEALDAGGRRDFWLLFHDAGEFRSCDECPHK